MLVKESSTIKLSRNNKKMKTMKLYPRDSQRGTKWKEEGRPLGIENHMVNKMIPTRYPQLRG